MANEHDDEHIGPECPECLRLVRDLRAEVERLTVERDETQASVAAIETAARRLIRHMDVQLGVDEVPPEVEADSRECDEQDPPRCLASDALCALLADIPAAARDLLVRLERAETEASESRIVFKRYVLERQAAEAERDEARRKLAEADDRRAYAAAGWEDCRDRLAAAEAEVRALLEKLAVCPTHTYAPGQVEAYVAENRGLRERVGALEAALRVYLASVNHEESCGAENETCEYEPLAAALAAPERGGEGCA